MQAMAAACGPHSLQAPHLPTSPASTVSPHHPLHKPDQKYSIPQGVQYSRLANPGPRVWETHIGRCIGTGCERPEQPFASGDLCASQVDEASEFVTDFDACIPTMKGFQHRYICSREVTGEGLTWMRIWRSPSKAGHFGGRQWLLDQQSALRSGFAGADKLTRPVNGFSCRPKNHCAVAVKFSARWDARISSLRSRRPGCRHGQSPDPPARLQRLGWNGRGSNKQ